MKLLNKVFLFLIELILILFLTTKAEEPPMGTYVSKIIINAPWGEKNLFDHKISSEPGKFGFSIDEEGLEHGPTAFTVAPNGDIYIADNMNNRVQHFSADGQFVDFIPNVRVGPDAGMCLDRQGNIYNGHFYTLYPYVKKYDQMGNLIRTYAIVRDPEMETDDPTKWGNGSIYCDDSNRVFILYKHGVFQLGTTDSAFSPDKQKASLMPGLFGYTSNVPDMKKGALMYRLLGKDTGPTYMLGMDKNYVYSWIQDEKNPEFKIVDKTDYEGNWIASYRLNLKQIECELLTVFSMGVTIRFDKGNIYVFCSDKEGVKIIRFSPVERSK